MTEDKSRQVTNLFITSGKLKIKCVFKSHSRVKVRNTGKKTCAKNKHLQLFPYCFGNSNSCHVVRSLIQVFHFVTSLEVNHSGLERTIPVSHQNVKSPKKQRWMSQYFQATLFYADFDRGQFRFVLTSYGTLSTPGRTPATTSTPGSYNKHIRTIQHTLG